jgi:hypothetical protein
VDSLTFALANTTSSDTKQLDDALALVCAEAHANDTPVEDVVGVLRHASAALSSTKPGTPRDSRYDSALLVLLALYYKEQQS